MNEPTERFGSVIREAASTDVPAILAMVHELADYEHAAHEVVADEAAFTDALFGPHPAAFAHVVECGGDVGGFALGFRNFSTWLG